MSDEEKVSEVEEVIFDYTISNQGRTHVLVVTFPEGCDEGRFLISLKSYLRAQSENLSHPGGKLRYN